jgi:4-amino-4-deoxy-L-arabinose transferase-like glycosyltransferase
MKRKRDINRQEKKRETGETAAPRRRLGAWRYPKTILVMATVACLMPFAAKAFHIDDPLFVWAGRQMQNRCWDPYGFDINWYGSTMPMHEVTKNPPLACALIALIASIFGENELILHIGFLGQAIAAILGVYVLGRRLCNHPVQAALAVLFTPVFMISSTTLMCDVLMLALWIWALVLWMRGLEDDQPLSLVLAALLVGACCLTKYFGIALIPLLLIYSLIRKGKLGWWLVYLPIPIVIIALYENAMCALYGHVLIWDAFRYVRGSEAHGAAVLVSKLLTILGFIGGCSAIVLICAPVLWRSRIWIGAIAALFLLPHTWILLSSLSTFINSPARLGIMLFWTLLILGGICVLALPILEWRHHRNAEIVMLWLWVWGTFVFCIFNWTVNGRSVLPMVPPVAILLLRQIESVPKATKLQLNCCLGAAAVCSLVVTLADYRLANSARAAAAEVRSKFGNSSVPIWFQGHWGFQYYAQANGLLPWNTTNPQFRAGDLLVVPVSNTNLKPIYLNLVERIATIEMPVLPGVATMSHEVGAGFYTDIVGPLPFSFGPVQREKYIVFRLKTANPTVESAP